MLAGGDRLLALGKVILDAEEVIAVLELAVLGVEAPAADSGAQGLAAACLILPANIL
jgi:hypothetical protein